MKSILLAVAFVLGTVGPSLPHLCLGAQRTCVQIVAATRRQERTLPEGEWCQRRGPHMPKEAHACDCHQADCTDKDPAHLPAHTDPMCLVYCTISQCDCPVHDCD